MKPKKTARSVLKTTGKTTMNGEGKPVKYCVTCGRKHELNQHTWMN